MKQTCTYKGVKHSESLNNKIKETFEKFENYFDQELTCHANISQKGKGEDTNCVEITIRAGKYTFRAESTTSNFYKSVDENFDKIKKQIRRHKDKLITKKRDREAVSQIFSANEVDEQETFSLIRKKSFRVYPMTIEEASMQMELLNHNFFVFTNIDTNQVNVVYKRNDGGYGLIETYQ